MLTKVTNSLYENILCLTFEMGSGLKLFGLVSPRGDFKLKTTLHGGTERSYS